MSSIGMVIPLDRLSKLSMLEAIYERGGDVFSILRVSWASEPLLYSIFISNVTCTVNVAESLHSLL